MKTLLFRLLTCVVLFAIVGASSLFAADLPKFSDSEVNAFVRDYSAYTDESIVLNKEVLADPSKATSPKMQALMAKSEAMMTKMTTVEAKLKADETEKFAKFIADCSQRMADGMK